MKLVDVTEVELWMVGEAEGAVKEIEMILL